MANQQINHSYIVIRLQVQLRQQSDDDLDRRSSALDICRGNQANDRLNYHLFEWWSYHRPTLRAPYRRSPAVGEPSDTDRRTRRSSAVRYLLQYWPWFAYWPHYNNLYMLHNLKSLSKVSACCQLWIWLHCLYYGHWLLGCTVDSHH